MKSNACEVTENLLIVAMLPPCDVIVSGAIFQNFKYTIEIYLTFKNYITSKILFRKSYCLVTLCLYEFSIGLGCKNFVQLVTHKVSVTTFRLAAKNNKSSLRRPGHRSKSHEMKKKGRKFKSSLEITFETRANKKQARVSKQKLCAALSMKAVARKVQSNEWKPKLRLKLLGLFFPLPPRRGIFLTLSRCVLLERAGGDNGSTYLIFLSTSLSQPFFFAEDARSRFGVAEKLIPSWINCSHCFEWRILSDLVKKLGMVLETSGKTILCTWYTF